MHPCLPSSRQRPTDRNHSLTTEDHEKALLFPTSSVDTQAFHDAMSSEHDGSQEHTHNEIRAVHQRVAAAMAQYLGAESEELRHLAALRQKVSLVPALENRV